MEVPLPRDSLSPYAARRALRQELERHGFPRHCIEDAVLLVSEIVTNAVLHGRDDICLTCDVDGSVARVGVSDGGDTRPTLLHPTPGNPTGRGLHIVGERAERWGVDTGSTGKTVWFEITRGRHVADASEQAGEPGPSRSPGSSGTTTTGPH